MAANVSVRLRHGSDTRDSRAGDAVLIRPISVVCHEALHASMVTWDPTRDHSRGVLISDGILGCLHLLIFDEIFMPALAMVSHIHSVVIVLGIPSWLAWISALSCWLLLGAALVSLAILADVDNVAVVKPSIVRAAVGSLLVLSSQTGATSVVDPADGVTAHVEVAEVEHRGPARFVLASRGRDVAGVASVTLVQVHAAGLLLESNVSEVGAKCERLCNLQPDFLLLFEILIQILLSWHEPSDLVVLALMWLGGGSVGLLLVATSLRSPLELVLDLLRLLLVRLPY